MPGIVRGLPKGHVAFLLYAAITLHLPTVAFDMDEADLAWMQEHPDESGSHPVGG